MSNRISRGKVLALPRAKSAVVNTAALSEEERERRAQELVLNTRGKAVSVACGMASKALEYSPNCVDAYLILAEAQSDFAKRASAYREAIRAGEVSLGKDWEKKYKGTGWGATETRSVMRAMFGLAAALRWDDKLKESLALYRKLMELNPHDNQGVRYALASTLLEAGLGDELEALLEQYKDDKGVVLLYTKALHLYNKSGAKKKSNEALIEAFNANQYIPILMSEAAYLEDCVDKIDDRKLRDAESYNASYGYLWGDLVESSRAWMAEALKDSLLAFIREEKFALAVVNGLRVELEED